MARAVSRRAGAGRAAPGLREPVGPGDTVVFLLSRLGSESARGFARALAPLHLEPRHAGLLASLAASEGRSQHAVACELGIRPSRMVGLVDELEDRGLVERRTDVADRRTRTLHLTTKGRRTLARVRAIGLAHEERSCAGLSAAERAELVSLLQRLARRGDEGAALHVHPELAGRTRPGISERRRGGGSP